jgi:hypothetical protein
MPSNVVVELAALLASPQAELLLRLPASLGALDAIPVCTEY